MKEYELKCKQISKVSVSYLNAAFVTCKFTEYGEIDKNQCRSKKPFKLLLKCNNWK